MISWRYVRSGRFRLKKRGWIGTGCGDDLVTLKVEGEGWLRL